MSEGQEDVTEKEVNNLEFSEVISMFRSIRNKRNEISTDEAKELLRSSRRGILAVNGDDGYPYAIPINYLYDEDAHKIVSMEPKQAIRWIV